MTCAYLILAPYTFWSYIHWNFREWHARLPDSDRNWRISRRRLWLNRQYASRTWINLLRSGPIRTYVSYLCLSQLIQLINILFRPFFQDSSIRTMGKILLILPLTQNNWLPIPFRYRLEFTSCNILWVSEIRHSEFDDFLYLEWYNLWIWLHRNLQVKSGALSRKLVRAPIDFWNPANEYIGAVLCLGALHLPLWFWSCATGTGERARSSVVATVHTCGVPTAVSVSWSGSLWRLHFLQFLPCKIKRLFSWRVLSDTERYSDIVFGCQCFVRAIFASWVFWLWQPIKISARL